MVTDDGDGDLKPNGNSVTSLPCTCPYLHEASEEPDNPIVFDVEMNEYHLTHFDRTGTGMIAHSIIQHCPCCGGTAPRSKRGTFFAHITHAENRVLRHRQLRLRDHPRGMLTRRAKVAAAASRTLLAGTAGAKRHARATLPVGAR